MRVAITFAQQTAPLAQRILIGRHVARMLGMQRRDQPIEEATALTRSVEEQAVELRCQPYRRDMQAERGLAGSGPTVDAHHPARQAGLALGRLQAGADGDPPVGRIERGGNRPSCWIRLLPTGAAADLVESCPAQATARNQEGEGLQQVGLAGAVGPDQHHRGNVAVEPELAVVAEIGQAQLADSEKCRRCTGYGVGGIGKGVDRRRRHTRIGMST